MSHTAQKILAMPVPEGTLGVFFMEGGVYPAEEKVSHGMLTSSHGPWAHGCDGVCL